MNIIKAQLIDKHSLKNINLLTFKSGDFLIKVLILQMNVSLNIGDIADLSIKPTKLFLTKEKCNFENVLKVKIKDIQKGEIVSSVIIEFDHNTLEVIMLSEMVDFDKEAYLLFKSSDISILGKSDG